MKQCDSATLIKFILIIIIDNNSVLYSRIPYSENCIGREISILFDFMDYANQKRQASDSGNPHRRKPWVSAAHRYPSCAAQNAANIHVTSCFTSSTHSPLALLGSSLQRAANVQLISK